MYTLRLKFRYLDFCKSSRPKAIEKPAQVATIYSWLYKVLKAEKVFFINTQLGPLVPLHTKLEGFPRGYGKIENKRLEKSAQVATSRVGS